MPSERRGSRPEFAIVGPPKTGTTALFAWLQEHPEVYLPEGKEVHFFDQHRERGLDWYVEQFAPAGERVSGEATTTYLGHPTAIEELAGLNPDILLVAVVRDPVDRAWSHYNYGVSRSWFRESFEAMVLRELGELVAGRDQPGGLVHDSRYGYLLERATRHVPAERILVLRHRDLEAEPDETFARVCRFLGVDDSVRPRNLGSRENQTRTLRSRRLFNAFLRTRLDRALPERFQPRLGSLLSTQGYRALEPDLRKVLDAVFAQDQVVAERFLAAPGLGRAAGARTSARGQDTDQMLDSAPG